MDLLKSLAVAFSTYSKIPMPQFEWKEKNMRYSMCFFPLIGAVIGTVMLLLNLLMEWLRIGMGLQSAVYTVLPLVITGGIHMDGYMDTTDALQSYRGKEERLRILKDPHIGAFAVIHAVILLILVYGLYTETDRRLIITGGFIFVISRCLSGIAVLTFPKAKKEGMLYAVSGAAKSSERTVLIVLRAELAAVVVGMVLAGAITKDISHTSSRMNAFGVLPVILSLAAAVILYCYYRYIACRKFGGTTGDLAGWFLTLCEFFMLLVLIVSKTVLFR